VFTNSYYYHMKLFVMEDLGGRKQYRGMEYRLKYIN